ncbi:MAG: type III pantothenate kinase [Woeseia sp.]
MSSDQRDLLFDIGNTRVKWGIAIDGEIRRTGTISHERLREQGYSALTTRLPTKVDAVLASNVAGQTFATRLSGVIGMHCNTDVHFARSAAEGFGVTNSYRQPRKLGVDRWVAMIGARAFSHKALCIVDAGTAVTIDALDSSGQHLGGQILPGIHLMNNALAEDTSDLPAVKRAASNKLDSLPGFASSTSKAIYSGAMGAVCGAVERAMRAMRSAGYRPLLILTGGDASRILPVLDGAAEHRPHLVLEGLAIINKGKQ